MREYYLAINEALKGQLEEEHWKIFQDLAIAHFLEGKPATSTNSSEEETAATSSNLLRNVARTLTTLQILNQTLFDPLHRLFYACLVLLTLNYRHKIDSSLRTAILQHLLPAAVKFWRNSLESLPDATFYQPGTDRDWLDVAWAIIKTTDCPASEAIPILARLLPAYLPWKDANTIDIRLFERHVIDIRMARRFINYLRGGLLDDDGALRKQSLYILKQIIKFNTIYLDPVEVDSAEGVETEMLFRWRAIDREKWAQVWRKFCLLYEAVHETQVHILEPLLSTFNSLVEDTDADDVCLPFDWWLIIARRAFRADSANVRRRILEAVLAIDLERATELSYSKEFNLNFLMKALDITSLYTMIPTSADVSALGMMVARYYARLLTGDSISVNDYLEAIKAQIRSATPGLFFLQAFLLVQPAKLTLRDSDVELLKYFSRNTMLFHNIKARRLLRWQLLHIFIRHANPSVLTFEDVASALTEFLSERLEQLSISSVEYSELQRWLKNCFGGDYLNQGIGMAVQDYFLYYRQMSTRAMLRKGQELATMLMFTLAQEGGFSQCVRPLYQNMAMMGIADNTTGYLIAGISLFCTLNRAVADVSQGQSDLLSCIEVSSRLYEWIALLETCLLNQTAEIPDLLSLQMLLKGMNLLFDKAAEESPTLISYLDILLFRLVGLLEVLDRARTEQVAETFEDQLRKCIILSLMSTSFIHLSRVGNYSADFINEQIIVRIFELELERPSTMTSSQSDDWLELVSSFAEARWKLISTIATFSKDSPTFASFIHIPDLFSHCLDALESASYRSVLAIFACMKVLVQLAPTSSLLSPSIIAESATIAFRLMEEIHSTPVWYFLYFESFVDYFFQPILLLRDDLAGGNNGEESLVARTVRKLILLAEKRKNLLPRLARNLHRVWNTLEGRSKSLMGMRSIFLQLLTYGPPRENVEDRIAGALTESNVEGNFDADIGSDYLVRVMMNDILLHMKSDDFQDKRIALSIVDDLLDSVIL